MVPQGGSDQIRSDPPWSDQTQKLTLLRKLESGDSSTSCSKNLHYSGRENVHLVHRKRKTVMLSGIQNKPINPLNFHMKAYCSWCMNIASSRSHQSPRTSRVAAQTEPVMFLRSDWCAKARNHRSACAEAASRISTH